MELMKTYHVTVSLQDAIKWKDRQLTGMICDNMNDRAILDDECGDLFIDRLQKWRGYLPVCDANGDDGKCVGMKIKRS